MTHTNLTLLIKALNRDLMALFLIVFTFVQAPVQAEETPSYEDIKYKTVEIDGLDIFYREAGNPSNPTILLLHGFPTSSHMFRDLIPQLADQYHLVAPDYPGYGYSSMPSVDEFEYSFDNVANIVDQFIDKVGLKTYSLYLMDYGAPIGFRIATNHP